jgi:hypothetical protein
MFDGRVEVYLAVGSFVVRFSIEYGPQWLPPVSVPPRNVYDETHDTGPATPAAAVAGYFRAGSDCVDATLPPRSKRAVGSPIVGAGKASGVSYAGKSVGLRKTHARALASTTSGKAGLVEPVIRTVLQGLRLQH